MFSDIGADWSSHVKSLTKCDGLEFFCPMEYTFEIILAQYELLFNVNENNIINNINDMDTNTHIRFSGPEILVNVRMPYHHFTPTHSEITYEVEVQNLRGELCLPQKHPLADLLGGVDLQFATCTGLTVDGTYRSHYKYNPAYRDSHTINIKINSLEGLCYGHFLRYLFSWQSNYFGTTTSHMTSAEFTRRGSINRLTLEKAIAAHKLAEQPPNAYESSFSLSINDIKLYLPEQLFKSTYHLKNTAQPCVRIYTLQMQSRGVQQYSSMSVNLSPIVVHIPMGTSMESEKAPHLSHTNDTIHWNEKETYLRLPDLSYTSHDSCGEAPERVVYRSSQLLYIGEVTGQLMISQVLTLISCMSNFGEQYEDAIDHTFPVASEVRASLVKPADAYGAGVRDAEVFDDPMPDTNFEVAVQSVRLNLLLASRSKSNSSDSAGHSSGPRALVGSKRLPTSRAGVIGLAVTQLELPLGLQLQTSTLVTPSAYESAVLQIPQIDIRHLTPPSEAPRGPGNLINLKRWVCVARMSTGIHVTKARQKSDWEVMSKKQQSFIYSQMANQQAVDDFTEQPWHESNAFRVRQDQMEVSFPAELDAYETAADLVTQQEVERGTWYTSANGITQHNVEKLTFNSRRGRQDSLSSVSRPDDPEQSFQSCDSFSEDEGDVSFGGSNTSTSNELEGEDPQQSPPSLEGNKAREGQRAALASQLDPVERCLQSYTFDVTSHAFPWQHKGTMGQTRPTVREDPSFVHDSPYLQDVRLGGTSAGAFLSLPFAIFSPNDGSSVSNNLQRKSLRQPYRQAMREYSETEFASSSHDQSISGHQRRFSRLATDKNKADKKKGERRNSRDASVELTETDKLLVRGVKEVEIVLTVGFVASLDSYLDLFQPPTTPNLLEDTLDEFHIQFARAFSRLRVAPETSENLRRTSEMSLKSRPIHIQLLQPAYKVDAEIEANLSPKPNNFDNCNVFLTSIFVDNLTAMSKEQHPLTKGDITPSVSQTMVAIDRALVYSQELDVSLFNRPRSGSTTSYFLDPTRATEDDAYISSSYLTKYFNSETIAAGRIFMCLELGRSVLNAKYVPIVTVNDTWQAGREGSSMASFDESMIEEGIEVSTNFQQYSSPSIHRIPSRRSHDSFGSFTGSLPSKNQHNRDHHYAFRVSLSNVVIAAGWKGPLLLCDQALDWHRSISELSIVTAVADFIAGVPNSADAGEKSALTFVHGGPRSRARKRRWELLLRFALKHVDVSRHQNKAFHDLDEERLLVWIRSRMESGDYSVFVGPGQRSRSESPDADAMAGTEPPDRDVNFDAIEANYTQSRCAPMTITLRKLLNLPGDIKRRLNFKLQLVGTEADVAESELASAKKESLDESLVMFETIAMQALRLQPVRPEWAHLFSRATDTPVGHDPRQDIKHYTFDWSIARLRLEVVAPPKKIQAPHPVQLSGRLMGGKATAIFDCRSSVLLNKKAAQWQIFVVSRNQELILDLTPDVYKIIDALIQCMTLFEQLRLMSSSSAQSDGVAALGSSQTYLPMHTSFDPDDPVDLGSQASETAPYDLHLQLDVGSLGLNVHVEPAGSLHFLSTNFRTTLGSYEQTADKVIWSQLAVQSPTFSKENINEQKKKKAFFRRQSHMQPLNNTVPKKKALPARSAVKCGSIIEASIKLTAAFFTTVEMSTLDINLRVIDTMTARLTNPSKILLASLFVRSPKINIHHRGLCLDASPGQLDPSTYTTPKRLAVFATSQQLLIKLPVHVLEGLKPHALIDPWKSLMEVLKKPLTSDIEAPLGTFEKEELDPDFSSGTVWTLLVEMRKVDVIVYPLSTVALTYHLNSGWGKIYKKKQDTIKLDFVVGKSEQSNRGNQVLQARRKSSARGRTNLDEKVHHGLTLHLIKPDARKEDTAGESVKETKRRGVGETNPSMPDGFSEDHLFPGYQAVSIDKVFAIGFPEVQGSLLETSVASNKPRVATITNSKANGVRVPASQDFEDELAINKIKGVITTGRLVFSLDEAVMFRLLQMQSILNSEIVQLKNKIQRIRANVPVGAGKASNAGSPSSLESRPLENRKRSILDSYSVDVNFLLEGINLDVRVSADNGYSKEKSHVDLGDGCIDPAIHLDAGRFKFAFRFNQPKFTEPSNNGYQDASDAPSEATTEPEEYILPEVRFELAFRELQLGLSVQEPPTAQPSNLSRKFGRLHDASALPSNLESFRRQHRRMLMAMQLPQTESHSQTRTLMQAKTNIRIQVAFDAGLHNMLTDIDITDTHCRMVAVPASVASLVMFGSRFAVALDKYLEERARLLRSQEIRDHVNMKWVRSKGKKSFSKKLRSVKTNQRQRFNRQLSGSADERKRPIEDSSVSRGTAVEVSLCMSMSIFVLVFKDDPKPSWSSTHNQFKVPSEPSHTTPKTFASLVFKTDAVNFSAVFIPPTFVDPAFRYIVPQERNTIVCDLGVSRFLLGLVPNVKDGDDIPSIAAGLGVIVSSLDGQDSPQYVEGVVSARNVVNVEKVIIALKGSLPVSRHGLLTETSDSASVASLNDSIYTDYDLVARMQSSGPQLNVDPSLVHYLDDLQRIGDMLSFEDYSSYSSPASADATDTPAAPAAPKEISSPKGKTARLPRVGLMSPRKMPRKLNSATSQHNPVKEAGRAKEKMVTRIRLKVALLVNPGQIVLHAVVNKRQQDEDWNGQTSGTNMRPLEHHAHEHASPARVSPISQDSSTPSEKFHRNGVVNDSLGAGARLLSTQNGKMHQPQLSVRIPRNPEQIMNIPSEDQGTLESSSDLSPSDRSTGRLTPRGYSKDQQFNRHSDPLEVNKSTSSSSPRGWDHDDISVARSASLFVPATSQRISPSPISLEAKSHHSSLGVDLTAQDEHHEQEDEVSPINLAFPAITGSYSVELVYGGASAEVDTPVHIAVLTVGLAPMVLQPNLMDFVSEILQELADSSSLSKRRKASAMESKGSAIGLPVTNKSGDTHSLTLSLRFLPVSVKFDCRPDSAGASLQLSIPLPIDVCFTSGPPSLPKMQLSCTTVCLPRLCVRLGQQEENDTTLLLFDIQHSYLNISSAVSGPDSKPLLTYLATASSIDVTLIPTNMEAGYALSSAWVDSLKLPERHVDHYEEDDVGPVSSTEDSSLGQWSFLLLLGLVKVVLACFSWERKTFVFAGSVIRAHTLTYTKPAVTKAPTHIPTF